MKKIIAGILVMGMGLMTACGSIDITLNNIPGVTDSRSAVEAKTEAGTETETAKLTEKEDTSSVPITDKSEVLALNHDFYVANTQTLFDRHESVEFTFLDKDNSRTSFIWESKEGMYIEWDDTDSAEYSFADNKYYFRSHDAENDTYDLSFGISAGADPLQLFYIVNSDNETGTSEHETVTAYREGDLIRIVSEFDEEWCRNLAAERGDDYDGGRYIFEFIIDADDYDVRETVDKLVYDGKEEVLSSIKVNYDTSEPSAATTLRAAFERNIENTMEINAVFDPGTENEIRYSFTIPENMNVMFSAGDKTTVEFDDPDGTTVSHWDRKSDLTRYIFTDPDEELLERYNNLVLQLMKN